MNSYFQTGLKNLIDLAVIAKQQELGAGELTERYTKVDEIPFDFERRRMSVVVQDRDGKTQLVTKGAGGGDAQVLRLGRVRRRGPTADGRGARACSGQV